MGLETDSALLNELRADMKIMAQQMTRLTATFEQWSPIWSRQADGMIALDNRQIKFESECNQKLAQLEERMNADKSAREDLQDLADKAQKQRAETQRWVVGTCIATVGMMLTVMSFLTQHVTLK